MKKPFQRALFIFRRDLRLEDNTGLIFALEQAKEVLCCFIFTSEQIENNPYRSDHCLQFMIESLEDLSEQLRSNKGELYLFWEDPAKIVEKCIDTLQVDLVVFNQDYTPYSLQRDQAIASVCKRKKIAFHSFHDALLQPPDQVLKADGKPYSIFTPFYRYSSKLEVALPQLNRYQNYFNQTIVFSENKNLYKKILPKRYTQEKGGRKEALKKVKNLKDFSEYDETRDFPDQDKTTHLSAHLKFTTCSVREIYYAIKEQLGESTELVRSLYWRDFFTTIAFHFPKVFKGSFHSKFDKLKYKNDQIAFQRWCEGNTGFPLIDAGMRQMNKTGYMHNRVRMVVASFLVKDLHIHWRWGERYFAQTLIDYDPAVNNGNWQWVSGTGCDAQPYFRVFNPWTQSTKFDPNCEYIKRWIPELARYPSKTIHNWYLQTNSETAYPKPIIDHAKESKRAVASYKKIVSINRKIKE